MEVSMSAVASSEIEDFWQGDNTSFESGTERQFTVCDEAPFDASTPYAREKARICKMAANEPSGLSLYGFVRRLEGVTLEEAGNRGSDNPTYQRVRRFVRDNPDFFEVETLSGVIVVYPTVDLFSLIFCGIVQTSGEETYTPGIEFCEDLLSNIRSEPTGSGSINWNWSEGGRWYLRQTFEDYLSRINARRIILGAQDPTVEPEFLCLPYRTRFNDEGRISKQWSLFDSMFEKAGEWYETAAFTTLTTDPAHFDSLWDAVAKINKNFNRLMSWLQSSSRLGYRPDYLKVLEFQESGNPHLHIVFFLDQENDGSMPWLVDKHSLDAYWEKWQGGYINDIQPLVYDGELGDEYGDETDAGWIRWKRDGDHGGLIESDRDENEDGCQTVGDYLGKYLSKMYGGILDHGTDESIAGDDRYEETADLWKIAMYWATGRKIRTESRDLRQAVEADRDKDENWEELMGVIDECRYRVVGTFRVENIPRYIQRDMVSLEQLIERVDEEESEPKPIIGPTLSPATG